MKKKTTLTKMHIAPSTVRYDAVAARDSNEVGQILAGTRKRNGYSLVTFSDLNCSPSPTAVGCLLFCLPALFCGQSSN